MNHPNTPPAAIEHVCFSGSPACSGCNPCPECQAYVQEQVLPTAFLASRMNETLLTLHNMIGVLLEKGVDPVRQMGIDLSRVFSSLEEQADGFFQGYVGGWARMHNQMTTDPSVRNRLHVRLVGAVETVGALPVPVSTPEKPKKEEPRTLTKEEPAMPGVDSWQKALEDQQRQWEEEEAREATGPVVQPPTPLTVEDVSALGMPIADLRNGSAS